MKGLVYLGPSQLAFQEMPAPTPAEGEALVRVRACGICGSDVHGYLGHTGRRTPPMMMGHEFAGEVVEVGPGAGRLKPGDRVLGIPSVGCGHCEYCMVNRPELCTGRRILGVAAWNGAMAEYVAHPAKLLLPLPDEVSFAEAAMVEPLAVAYHGMRRRPPLVMEDVLIAGVGTVGLLLLQLVAQAGPRRIFVSDIVDGKLDQARGYGATHTFNPEREDVVAGVLEATGGRGVDLAYEVVGYPETLQTCMAATRAAGDVLVIGNLQKMGEIHIQGLVTREQRLIGSYTGTPMFGPSMDLIAAGRIDLQPFLGEVWPFDRGIEAFERLAAGEETLRKVILTM